MSVSSIQSQIASVQREIASLRAQVARESKAEADLAEKRARLQRDLNSTKSAQTASSKARELERIERDVAAKVRRRADLEKRVADQTTKLNRLDQDLRKEQDRDQKRFRDQLERRERERQSRELSSVRSDLALAVPGALAGRPAIGESEYDAFIAHASEDKDFVGPLAEALTEAGLRVWYDEFELSVGDSLRRSIDRGLSRSRFGIVVLSPAFFAKGWPQYELDGLVTRELHEQQKIILPIWHHVSKDDVVHYSASLADKVALRTADYTTEEIAALLADAIRSSSG